MVSQTSFQKAVKRQLTATYQLINTNVPQPVKGASARQASIILDGNVVEKT
jgi:hypothetical protein